MARKRKNGHFEPSSGLYAYSFEMHPLTGRRRKVIRAKTQALLDEKIRAYKQTLAQTGTEPTTSMSVEAWISYWLDAIAKNELRPTTLRNYRSLLTTHTLPLIGKVRLDKLTPAHIRLVNDRVLAAGRSSTTALTVHRAMSSALTAAEREGKVGRNVARIVAPPRRTATELEVLTVEEAVRLVSMFGQTEEAYLWAVFLLTGARRGEVLGLEWNRVTDVLDLSWQLQRHPAGTEFPYDYEHRNLSHGLYLTRPKSAAGVRVVPLVEPLRSILNGWRLASPAGGSGLLFTMPDGAPIDPNYASHQWPKVLAAAGIHRKVRLHDLRHTTVDLLYEAGVDEDVIREIVGHSTRAMTRSYRSRATKERLTRALEPFSALFNPSGAVG